jgi:Holliday junction resolvase
MTEEQKRENEEKGDKAEELFRKYLNSENIPFYRIDQKQETKSEELKNKSMRRPDYIIHTKKGVFYIDVKYRTKRPFGQNDENRFYLDQFDIDSLYNFQDELNSVVWVAFTDNEENGIFFYAPIYEIYEYTKNIFSDEVREKYSAIKENIEECFIHIPETLLYAHLSFDNGFNEKVDLKFYESESQYHIEKAKEIKDPKAMKAARINSCKKYNTGAQE